MSDVIARGHPAGRDRPLAVLSVSLGRAGHLVPGIALTSAVAAAAYALHRLPGLGAFSPMILAIGLGMAGRNLVGTPAIAQAGVVFSLKRLLRLGVMLLGLRLTIQQVAAVGGRGIAVIAATLLATFLVTRLLGRLLGVERKLAELIAAGTSICGASAVVVTNTVTRGSDEDVAYAVACVTVFGSASMLLYPALPALLHLDGHQFGLWAGASIHEVAQVVAASFQDGPEAGNFGTIAKLSRVMMLAPMIILLGLAAARRAPASAGAKRGLSQAPLPAFILGFLLLAGVNSIGIVPREAAAIMDTVTTILLTMSLAAMGLETDIGKLRAKGFRPLALGFLSWIFISCFSLALVELLY